MDFMFLKRIRKLNKYQLHRIEKYFMAILNYNDIIDNVAAKKLCMYTCFGR